MATTNCRPYVEICFHALSSPRFRDRLRVILIDSIILSATSRHFRSAFDDKEMLWTGFRLDTFESYRSTRRGRTSQKLRARKNQAAELFCEF